MEEWARNHPFWMALLRVVLWIGPLFLFMPLSIWFERRLLAWMQDRIGPNRVGNITFSRTSPWVPGFLKGRKFHLRGLLQPVADGIKLLMKEEIIPSAADRLVYFIAPAIAIFPAFALGAVIPWGPQYQSWTQQPGPYSYLTPVADVNIGVLYILAASSLGVYGLVLAGYGANNKYSLLGGLRASAQLISYELSMGMSIACVALASGSIKVTGIVAAQEQPLWGAAKYFQNWNVLTPFGLVAMVVFLVCMVAETNRPPFDLAEAENELVAGYHTEYSSMKFASFFMGEYVAMFAFGLLVSAIFLGGYNALPIRWEALATDYPSAGGFFTFCEKANYWLAPVFFAGKGACVVIAYIWTRATLPRLRYDQLMSLGWRSLLPVATLDFIVVALWLVGTRLYGVGGGYLAAAVALVLCVVLYLNIASVRVRARAGSQGSGSALASRTIELVEPVVQRQ